MKASTLKALRLPAGILLVFGILTIAGFVYSDRLNKANPPRGCAGHLSPQQRFRSRRGECKRASFHHRWSLRDRR